LVDQFFRSLNDRDRAVARTHIVASNQVRVSVCPSHHAGFCDSRQPTHPMLALITSQHLSDFELQRTTRSVHSVHFLERLFFILVIAEPHCWGYHIMFIWSNILHIYMIYIYI